MACPVKEMHGFDPRMFTRKDSGHCFKIRITDRIVTGEKED